MKKLHSGWYREQYLGYTLIVRRATAAKNEKRWTVDLTKDGYRAQSPCMAQYNTPLTHIIRENTVFFNSKREAYWAAMDTIREREIPNIYRG
tara:strand:- start:419 stop:694 length:276 start_codon:yes stop_codon:yes gene_type:complete